MFANNVTMLPCEGTTRQHACNQDGCQDEEVGDGGSAQLMQSGFKVEYHISGGRARCK